MDYLKKNKINICSDPILKEKLEDRGIEAYTFDTILSSDEKTFVLESLDKFFSVWFIKEDSLDYTEYRGVSIGAAIHDELMTIFHLLVHFIFILDKVGLDKNINFYHSFSYRMPEYIVDFLKDCNVEVTLIDEKYPWLSYKEQLNKQAKANFSRISFRINDNKISRLRPMLGDIKFALRERLSKMVLTLFNRKSNRNIYLHVHRSLVHFYGMCLENKRDFNIYITDTTPLEPKKDKKKPGIFKDLSRLCSLARRGVAIDSLKCPFYYKWYNNYKKEPNYKRLVDDFDKELKKNKIDYLVVDNRELLDYFKNILRDFYVRHLVDFMRLIDFYYEKFSKLKLSLCLQEMCHPFQAQVLANLKVPCRMYPSNYILHNQYFTPALLDKTKNYFKPVAFSELDAKRFERLGFLKENIKISRRDFLKPWVQEVRPLHKIVSLKKKRVLVLAPSIIAMDAFRYQVQNQDLYRFFSELFEVLSAFDILSVTIRPHPGANISRNQYGYTDNDILHYLVSNIDTDNVNFHIIFSNSNYSNLKEDILSNDIIIANLSGAVFESLIFGRDYILFDKNITPNYGTKDWSIFNEGTIKKISTKDDLKKYLTNYEFPDLNNLRNRLFGDILSQRNEGQELNSFVSFD